ncbi:MAG: nucleotidyltransferase family protein [Undibacterium sp.]|nr:nucleotidyltransferase family protein [Undibacterium sp.]
MKAMLLAAGRGERMRPLTDTCPKPLLKLRGRPLIVWHILNLVKAGITEIVINHSHLGHMIVSALGDGSQFGAKITYSFEEVALETAGGIAQALPLLGPDAFIVVSADIYTPHFNFEDCKNTLEDKDMWGNPHPLDKRDMAWLYMVKNPDFHPEGDFGLSLMGLSNHALPGESKVTFGNIGVYRPEIFSHIPSGTSAKLGPLLRELADRGQLGGEMYRGIWHNVGTPLQLAELNTPVIPQRPS